MHATGRVWSRSPVIQGLVLVTRLPYLSTPHNLSVQETNCHYDVTVGAETQQCMVPWGTAYPITVGLDRSSATACEPVSRS